MKLRNGMLLAVALILAGSCQTRRTALAENPVSSGIPIKLAARGHHVEVTEKDDGLYHVRTLGGDPYISAEFLAEPIDPRTQHIITFDYTADRDPGHFQVFYGPPISAESQAVASMTAASEWTQFRIDLKETGKNFWGPIILFRFDFGSRAGVNFKIRNIRLLGPASDKRVLAPGPSERLVTVEVDVVVIDFGEEFERAKSENSLSTRLLKELRIGNVDGKGIFQHSPGDVSKGNARLVFADVAMPKTSGNEKLVMSYYKGLNVDHTTKDRADGVGFVVAVDGQEVHRSLNKRGTGRG